MRMMRILVEVLLGVLVLLLFAGLYMLSSNERFNSWLEGRRIWREISTLAKR